MNRQLYAEGGIKSLLDIITSNPEKFGDILNILENVPREFMGGPYMGRPPKRNKRMPEEKLLEEFRDTRPVPRTENDFMRRYRQGRPEMKQETDEEVMERLMELQKRPEYQYNEENMYEGPRDMRMTGGITNAPIVNNRAYAFGGLGGIVSGIGKAVGSIAGGIGDAVGSVVEKGTDIFDPIAQIASFVPGPHQPFAAAYTGARGAGIGGDYGGLQIGGFTPSGSMFGVGGGGTSPFSTSFQAGAGQTPMNMGLGSLNIPGIGDVPTSDVLRTGSQFVSKRQGGGGYDQGQQEMGTTDIIGKIIQGGLSLYGAKKSYEDQQRINEAQQREYENFIRKQEEARKRYKTGEGLQSMDVRNRFREKADVVARPGVMGGGMMDLDVRTNPQGVKEIDYRKKGGFVPPIGIKEKADDIPAMLSNNEFVFTADAVRGAGKGSVNEGAKKMYALMKKLEAGGKV